MGLLATGCVFQAVDDVAVFEDFARSPDLAAATPDLLARDLAAVTTPDLATSQVLDLGRSTDLAGALSGCNPPCASGSVCVRDQILGGALFLVDDGGVCPPGRHAVRGFCEADPVYACAPLPNTCGATVDCACAGGLCQQQNACPYTCRAATAAEVDCECDVP